MPLRDVIGAELAKLKRLVHGFGSWGKFFCLFFSSHTFKMSCGAAWNLWKFWKSYLYPESLWGSLTEVLFSDPWNYWGACWVTGVGTGKRCPCLTVRIVTAPLALWCITLAGLLLGMIMGGLCFALLQCIAYTTQKPKTHWWRLGYCRNHQ